MFRVVRLARKANQIQHCYIQRCLASTAAQVKPAPTENQPAANLVHNENRSFIMNLYRGQIEGAEVFPYPDVLNEEQKETVQMLIEPIEKFFNEINDPALNDTQEKVADKSMNALWELGLLGLQVPTEYGGLGLNNTQYARLVEIVGKYDLGLGITLGAHQSIGFKGILLYGTPEQKAKYLPMVTGGNMAAFCLTEPSSGSDASSIRSRAVLSEDGKYYILNGSKIWISNGGLAEVMTVFAQTQVPDPKTGGHKDKVTAFIVERSFGGVTNGPPEKKMGIKASNTTEVYYEDVKIPIENVLGGVGNGFKVAMNILNNGRFGMAACLAGTMRICTQKAVDHATTRVQFGKRIDSFDSIKEKFARMAMLQYVTESIAYLISSNMDNKSEHYHLEAAVSKCFASEAAWYVCDEAIQVLGGMGFMKEAGLERFLRDLRIFRIFEGTNDILRLFVALTGIQYAGTHLKELQKAFKNPTANLGLIFEETSKRVVRKVGLSSPPSMDHLVHKDLVSSVNLVAKSIDEFGQVIESNLIKYGKNIVDQQCVLNRLANATFDIYTSVVVLSRASKSLNENTSTANHEKLMAETWVSEAYKRTKHNLKEVSEENTRNHYSKLRQIGGTTCESGGIAQLNPLTF